MKRLIKRYVLKAQVDKENDEVNEGKSYCRLLNILVQQEDSECCPKNVTTESDHSAVTGTLSAFYHHLLFCCPQHFYQDMSIGHLCHYTHKKHYLYHNYNYSYYQMF